MIFIRELSKNLALLAPTSAFETMANYAVLRTSSFTLRPKVVKILSKQAWHIEIHDQIDHDKPLLYLEFGVYKGRSIRLWSQANEHPNSQFFGFDSFVGLPEIWRQRPRGYFSTEGKIPDIEDSRVTFVKGWFNKTLPLWLQTHSHLNTQTHTPVVHIDSDLYSSALYVLTRLHDFFSQYYVVFDDYGAGEARALRDYLSAYNAGFQPIMGRKRRRYSIIPGQVFGIITTQPQSHNDDTKARLGQAEA